MMEKAAAEKRAAHPRFNPHRLSSEGARALRSLFIAGKYADMMSLPRPGGGSWLGELAILVDFIKGNPNSWATTRLFRYYESWTVKRTGPLPLLLYRLFWLSEGIPRQEIDTAIDGATFNALTKAQIFVDHGTRIWSSVRCFSYKGLYFLHDVNRNVQDFVYFGTDSPLMMDVVDDSLGERRFCRSLDLCTGSGIQGIHTGRRSDEQVCVDLNPRSVAFAEANAALNGLSNVTGVQSDMFSNLTGRFDYISANTPYVPLAYDPDAADLPLRGGDMGIEFTMLLIEALPDYLTDRGMAIIYTSDPIVRGRPVLQNELRQRFSHLPYKMEQILLFRNRPQNVFQERHWRKCGLDSFDDCILLICPHKGHQQSRREWNSSYYWRSRVMSRLTTSRRGTRRATCVQPRLGGCSFVFK